MPSTPRKRIVSRLCDVGRFTQRLTWCEAAGGGGGIDDIPKPYESVRTQRAIPFDLII